ncbi:MAG TPA: hypothetical protein VE664_08275 [Actinomycetes bacterium]|jgi:hypothetical protein|nr:hypothetical protein [Actinomycetes bacterium]
MAVFFLVLAIAVGVVIGDAVVANTGANNVELFNQTITGFTQGQLLVIAAGAGFVFGLLLFLAWGSSRSRRLRRRERREVHRDMEGRIGELERENADLRDEVDRDRRTSRVGAMTGADDTTQTSGGVFSRRPPDSLDKRAARTSGESTDQGDLHNRADR